MNQDIKSPSDYKKAEEQDYLLLGTDFVPFLLQQSGYYWCDDVSFAMASQRCFTDFTPIDFERVTWHWKKHQL